MKKILFLLIGLIVILGFLFYKIFSESDPSSESSENGQEKERPLPPEQAAPPPQVAKTPSKELPAEQPQEEGATAALTIQIERLKNNNGASHISIFRSAYGFPILPEKAYKILSIPIKDHRSTVTLNLPVGKYAIGVFHDENRNGILDTQNGIPIEGTGVSNNVRRHYAPPKFEDARFALESEGKTLKIFIHNY